MIIIHHVQEYTLQVHKSLLVGDFRSAAEISLHAHNISDALMIAIAGGFDESVKKIFSSFNDYFLKGPNLSVTFRHSILLAQRQGKNHNYTPLMR